MSASLAASYRVRWLLRGKFHIDARSAEVAAAKPILRFIWFVCVLPCRKEQIRFIKAFGIFLKFCFRYVFAKVFNLLSQCRNGICVDKFKVNAIAVNGIRKYTHL